MQEALHVEEEGQSRQERDADVPFVLEGGDGDVDAQVHKRQEALEAAEEKVER